MLQVIKVFLARGRYGVICPECGHDNPAGTQFCPVCDAFLGQGAPSGPAPGSASSPPPVPARPLSAPVPARPPAAPASPGTGLRLELEPDQIAADPGETAGATLSVRNTGTLVEEYALAVEGPPWITIEPSVLRIYPGQEATAALRVAPPRQSSSAAGRGGFHVTVTATVHRGVASTVGGTVTLSAFHGFRAELSPQVGRGGGRTHHKVVLVNEGNAPLPVRLRVLDDAGLLRIDMPQSVEVAGGQTVAAPVTVRTRRPWFGQPETYAFMLIAEPGAGQAPVRLNGRREVRAWFPSWVRLAAAVGALLAVVVVVGAMLLPQLGGVIDQNPPAAPSEAGVEQPAPGESDGSTVAPVFRMPNLVGQDADSIRGALENRGFSVEVREVTVDNVAVNTIVGTDPAAGESVEAGGTVTLFVPDAAAEPDVIAPN